MNIIDRQKKYSKKAPINELKAEKHSSEWVMDKKGFFLIDPRPEEGLVYAHHYHADKSYNLTITGKTAEDIYYTILREELVDSMMHAAYLGSELQKAEILVRYGIDWYIQDQAFDIPKEELLRHLNNPLSPKDSKNGSFDVDESPTPSQIKNKDPLACEVIKPKNN